LGFLGIKAGSSSLIITTQILLYLYLYLYLSITFKILDTLINDINKIFIIKKNKLFF